jgi:hypothetical protein
MTNEPPILRNSALAAPVSVGLAAFFGWDHAVAAAVSSALVLGNAWALSKLGPAVVGRIARGERVAPLAALLLGKMIVFFGVYLFLLRFLPGLGLGLGFVSLTLGTLLTGLSPADAQPSTGEA